MCLLAISQAADSIGQSRDYGVLKGFIGVSAAGDGGFWMTHSIEKYPDLARGARYGYFPAKEQAGHSMLCVSLSMAQLNELSHTVSATRPNVRQRTERALARVCRRCRPYRGKLEDVVCLSVPSLVSIKFAVQWSGRRSKPAAGSDIRAHAFHQRRPNNQQRSPEHGVLFPRLSQWQSVRGVRQSVRVGECLCPWVQLTIMEPRSS